MSTTTTESRFRDVIDVLRGEVGGDGNEVKVVRVPTREASFGTLAPGLHERLESALSGMGVSRLYTHQVEAISSIRQRRHTVVVTGTASGKSICYQLPLLEALLDDPGATALLLFPTKALAQDQLRAFTRFTDTIDGLKKRVLAGTYDGDTSAHTRRKLRDQGSVILTNPDMMHVGILPYHSRWHRFLENLRYVVIDEMHTYRGIFGSHVAQVLRRFRRVLDHYGLSPTFVFCSATIGNPGELARRLIGDDVHVVDRDGSPSGPRTFVFWNPPYRDETRLERRSSNLEGQRWLTELVKRGIPTIVFTRTRVAAELIYRYATEALAKEGRALGAKISPYRGGYLPRERREIEKKLFSGELLGVVSTNALELGIDVGTLDAAVLVGFPRTVASTLQRAGRAGRGSRESLVVIAAYNEPADQYLVRRPENILGRSPEHAVLDTENPYILASQLSCAAAELPLGEADARYFGGNLAAIADALEEEKLLKRLHSSWYWSGDDFPAARVNLRNISDDTFTIMDLTRKNEVIGNVDATSAPELLYPEAIYLHEGRTYFVRELDLEQKVAFVEPREVDYYTQALVDDWIRVERETTRRKIARETVCFGDLEVKWATTAFKKIQFYHLDAIGFHTLDLPYQELATTGFWYVPSPEISAKLRGESLSVREGLAGLVNVLAHILPMYVMCDRRDLGTTLEAGNLGLHTLFVYDRYPGGLGFAEKGFERLEEVLAAALELVSGCDCKTGCPSCVGVPPVDLSYHDDPEAYPKPAIPGKAATRRMLELLVGATSDIQTR